MKNSVICELLGNTRTAPLLVKPQFGGVDLASWLSDHRDQVEAELFRHAAVLFRGFDVKSVTAFEECAKAISRELFADYGDLPPEPGGGGAYKSTPYPADETILFHNEGSHTPRWPMKQWFCCMHPPVSGGETPVADCRKVFQSLDGDVVEAFRRKHLMYVRNFTPGLDVAWQAFFKTEKKSDVEKYCRNQGIDFEWKNDYELRTRHVCPAFARHPHTGEAVFFNQVLLHHISCAPAELRESLLDLYAEEDLPRNVHYGDGTPIEGDVIEQIREAYWRNAAVFPWQTGDILMLDNMLAAHARNPYQGPRRIIVAMAEMTGNRNL